MSKDTNKYKYKPEGEKDVIREKDRRKKKRKIKEQKEDAEEDKHFERSSF